MKTMNREHRKLYAQISDCSKAEGLFMSRMKRRALYEPNEHNTANNLETCGSLRIS